LQGVPDVYDKASFAKETAKNKHEAAATEMFQFYNNLLSSDAKYSRNKIVWEQTEADLFKDLHGVSRKGPRGLTWESFNYCVMFHLLTVFPNNAAEQEKYYLSNVLKKPQRVGVRGCDHKKLASFRHKKQKFFFFGRFIPRNFLADTPIFLISHLFHFEKAHRFADRPPLPICTPL
jgi:hypothetical protein